MRNGDKPRCPRGHPYAGRNLYRRPGKGWRTCKRCRADSERRRYHERRRTPGRPSPARNASSEMQSARLRAVLDGSHTTTPAMRSGPVTGLPASTSRSDVSTSCPATGHAEQRL